MLVRMRKAAIPSFALLFIFAALVEGVSHRPRTALFLTALLCLGFLLPLARYRIDNSLTSWFPQKDPAFIRYRSFQDRFGGDETVSIVYRRRDHKAGSLFSADVRDTIAALSDEISSMPGIARTTTPYMLADPRLLMAEDRKTAIVIAHLDVTDRVDAVRGHVRPTTWDGRAVESDELVRQRMERLELLVGKRERRTLLAGTLQRQRTRRHHSQNRCDCDRQEEQRNDDLDESLTGLVATCETSTTPSSAGWSPMGCGAPPIPTCTITFTRSLPEARPTSRGPITSSERTGLAGILNTPTTRSSSTTILGGLFSAGRI